MTSAPAYLSGPIFLSVCTSGRAFVLSWPLHSSIPKISPSFPPKLYPKHVILNHFLGSSFKGHFFSESPADLLILLVAVFPADLRTLVLTFITLIPSSVSVSLSQFWIL